MRAAVLPVRMPRTLAGEEADGRAAVRAVLLLPLQSLQRQSEGMADVRSAVRPAKADCNEVPDEEVAHGAAAARERK